MEEHRVNIGEMDTLVTVQSVTQTIGNRGQKTFTRQTVGRVYARLEWQVDETPENNNLEELRTVEVAMYKIPGMNTRWQLLIDGDPFDIVAIDPIDRWSKICILTCRTAQQL